MVGSLSGMMKTLKELYWISSCKNSANYTCAVTASFFLTTCSAYFTVKKNLTDTSASLAITGSHVSDHSGGFGSGSIFSFGLSPISSSMAAGHYVYDIVVESGSNHYTVVQDDFNVLDIVLY